MVRSFPYRHSRLSGEPLSSPEGLERLVRSGQAQKFFHIANFYRFQTDAFSCGPTSASIVLNALGYGSDSAPASGDGIRAYTPENIFSSITEAGLELEELRRIIADYDLTVEKRVMSADSKMEQRQIFLEALQAPASYVIANFSRESGGHFSPVVAYDRLSDSVLILDTNPSQQPWNWMPLETLLAAMETRDRHENRGYLVVEKD